MTLKEILGTLRRRFWLIIAGALIAGVVAAVLSLVWPRTYQAEALLLISKLRSNVTLDPRFQTVAEENVVNMTVQEDQVRRQTLVALAQSPDVARQTLMRLKEELPTEQQSVGYLKSAIDVHTEGNLVVFSVRADDPQKAATIANVWAEVYRTRVNRLYSGTSPSEAQIQGQLEDARASYESTKSAVEAFLRQNPEGELTRQIDQKVQILADLQTTRLAAAKQRESALLSYIRQMDQLVLQVQSMKQQLASTSADASLTAGEQFSLFSLESAAYAQQDGSPVTLEVGQGWPVDGNLTAGQALEHMGRLADTLKTTKAAAQKELDGLSLDLLGGKDLLAPPGGGDDTSATRIAKLQEEINALQAELERQKTVKQDLIDARDVAQQNHLTVMRKAAEVQILSQLTGVEVESAAEAQAPEVPVFPRPLLTTVLGVLAGGLAGLALAVVLELWPKV